MNIASLFTVAGLKAAWAKLMAASLAVKLGVGVAAVASSVLILYGVYKLCKYLKRPKEAAPLEGQNAATDKTEQEADATPKIGLGQRIKNWFNPSRIMGYVDSKVRGLRTELKSRSDADEKRFTALNTRIDQLNAIIETNKKTTDDQLATLKPSLEEATNKKITAANIQAETQFRTLNQKVAGVEGQLGQTNQSLSTRLGTVETRVGTIAEKTTRVERQMGSFAHLRNAAEAMQDAANQFTRDIRGLPPVQSANEEVLSDDASEASETPAAASVPVAVPSSPRNR